MNFHLAVGKRKNASFTKVHRIPSVNLPLEVHSRKIAVNYLAELTFMSFFKVTNKF
jgi:hypothetical protein